MRFVELNFRFRWVPTLLLALPIPLFVALGFWQIDRAEQKREQARVLAERAEMPPLELGGPIPDPEALRFRKLQARGTFEAAGQILIENRRQGNRIGFHVITPLRILGSDSRVLVNRGWIAAADGGPVAVPIPAGVLSVTGEAHLPQSPALVLHGDPAAAKNWGERWPYLTLELYRAATGIQVQPVVILQNPEDAGGFLRIWPRELPKDGMHIGYAIQWFAFALIALVLWLRLSLVAKNGVRS
ncbi:MAG: SURF1 family protein [Candidatus Thiosymbion ectosymbiont of Robbea hypermnestra]|nr:SURF1 family protein [Candidatus Thiosymbion ectosymbiont of Robbea hypermnestra]